MLDNQDMLYLADEPLKMLAAMMLGFGPIDPINDRLGWYYHHYYALPAEQVQK
jgi:hypothetical protein